MSFEDEYLCNWEETRTPVFTREEVIKLYDKGLISRNMIEPVMKMSYEVDGKLSRPLREDPPLSLEDIHYLRFSLGH